MEWGPLAVSGGYHARSGESRSGDGTVLQGSSILHEIVTEDPIAQARMRNVGVLSCEDAIRYGAVGPTARASGVRWDLRHSSSYEAYGDFDDARCPQDYYGKAYGDVFDRFLVRVHEVYQSLDIIDKVMAGLPEGDIVWEKNTTKVLQSLKKAEGTGWSSIEAPRGDDTHVVHLESGDENVTWWKVRAPTYANAVSWPVMFRENELADAPLIINSIDPASPAWSASSPPMCARAGGRCSREWSSSRCPGRRQGG